MNSQDLKNINNSKSASSLQGANSRKRMIIGTVLTLAGASFWGLCSVVSKYLITDKGLDTMWMTNFRMLSAGVLMLIIASFGNRNGLFDIWKSRKSAIHLILLAVIGFAICQITYFLAIDYSNAGIATALQQTAPIMVLVLVLFKEHRLPRAYELLVLFLAISGSFLLATGGNWGELNISTAALVCGLTSALACVGYIMMPAPLIKVYGTFETIGWGLCAGGLMISPVCELWSPQLTLDMGTVLGLIFIVVFGAVVPFASYLYGTTIVGPVRASVYGLIEPVLATLASLVFLHETFSLSDYVGISAILAGILVLSLKKKNSDG